MDDDNQTASITVSCDENGVLLRVKDDVEQYLSNVYTDYESMIELLQNTMAVVELGKKKYDGKGHLVV